MALVACPNCGAKVPDTRWACPQCGAPITPDPAALAALRAEREAAGPAPSKKSAPPPVRLTGIDLPYSDLVWLLFKWSLAVVPVAVFWAGLFLVVNAVARALIARYGL